MLVQIRPEAFGAIAQLVEYLAEDQGVAGSNPARTTFCLRGSVVEFFIGNEEVSGSIPLVGF